MRLTDRGPGARSSRAALSVAQSVQDLCHAGTVGELVLEESPTRAVSVELVPVIDSVPGGS